MPRLSTVLLAITTSLSAGAALAQAGMTPTAPQKMMPPAEKARLEVCQHKAAEQHVAMDARAKFVMDCMKAMAK